jgi:preprotein translocase subunit SecE
MNTELIVSLIVVAALAGLGIWLWKSGRAAKTQEFLSEVRSEMRKVSFPSRDEVVGTTVVVVITSVVFAFYLWVADFVIQKGYVAFIGVFS